MTERLSPSQWRDLATFWAYWVGDARVSKMMMDHAGHMEGASVGEDKPAPAADDLVERLRTRAVSAPTANEAAALIEAQAREIAQWQDAAGKNAVRAEQLEDMHEKTARDYGAIKARVARLTAILREWRRDYGDNSDPDTRLMIEKTDTALAEANDAQG